MSLKELSTAMKESLKPQRKEAEELFDKWSAVMKEATITLSNWDTETEHVVRLIDETEQKQVMVLCIAPANTASDNPQCLDILSMCLDCLWVVIIFRSLHFRGEHVTMQTC